MSNMLEDGAIELRRTLLEYASNSVVYSRGAQHVTLSAVLGSSLLRVQSEEAVHILKTERDYFINPEDMGALYPPQKDDLILDGSIYYKVLHIPGERVYDHEDQMGELVRVHVKQVPAS